MLPQLMPSTTEMDNIDEKVLIKICKQILHGLPDISAKGLIGNDESTWSETHGIPVDDLFGLVDFLINVWRYTVYYQPKYEELKQKYVACGIPDNVSEKFLSLWSVEGPTLVDRLGRITSTNVPRVTDVQYSTQLRLSSSSVPEERAPELNLQLSTTKGEQRIILSKEDLLRLYEECNRIQASIDKIME